jgi:hypothetical protein
LYESEKEKLYLIEGSGNIINKNFYRNSIINYNIFIKIKDSQNINFLNSYSKNWKVYLKNQQSLFTTPLFENTHKKIYNYANSWTISKKEIINYIKENYSDELEKEGYPKKLED